MSRESVAVEHLVRAKQLLADLDRSARGVDVSQVRAGVSFEVSAALSALQQGAVGDRDGKQRSDAPATSRAAARRIKVKSGTQRGRILLAIAAAGLHGATDFELTGTLRIQPSSLRPRRGELVDEGYVAPSPLGTRSHNGSEWTVWMATEAGLVLARSLARQLPRLEPPKRGEQMTLT